MESNECLFNEVFCKVCSVTVLNAFLLSLKLTVKLLRLLATGARQFVHSRLCVYVWYLLFVP